ncbi:MBL fold metallo-hydrolase [Flavobacteriaceae bacterium 3-367]|uniref:MBL fold metallo-hydrolase n=1 Tax=Eudoraea algarum TaxID=3417568 RepID=UPI003271C585
MELQLIRNATLKLNYAGKVLLIDPMFSIKETFPPFAPGLQKNPIVNLTMLISEIIENLDGILITHLHPDHLDEKAIKTLSKDTKLFCTPEDESFMIKHFNNVSVIQKELEWEGLSITRIAGQHGSGPILPHMGQVSGYVIQAKEEPTVYIVSDSILIDEVRNAVEKFSPELIVTNSGGGIIPNFEDYPVHMDEKQTIELSKLSPNSKLVAVHLEAIDFCRVTRESLRLYADKNGVERDRILIPDDGEIMSF